MKLLIATASNNAVRDWRDLCAESMERYCESHQDVQCASLSIPEDYERAPGWFKIGVIVEFLPKFDYVLTLDPDTLIVGNRDFAEIIQPSTLNIAKDGNGINCGVMAWRNCSAAFDALNRLEALYPEFKGHIWNEQAALMTFVDELDVFYQPKSIWNAYPHFQPDVTDETMIVHWPGGPPGQERARLMRKFQQKQAA